MYKLDPPPLSKNRIRFLLRGSGGGSVHRLLESGNHSVESRIQDCLSLRSKKEMTAKISKRNKNLALSTFCRETFQQLPRRLSLSLDENVRAKEGGKETTSETSPSHSPLRCITSRSPLPCENEAPEEEAVSASHLGKQSGRYKTQVTGHRCRLESRSLCYCK